MRRRILASFAKSGYTAKDYVQDGLIAMWDGIENAGWGVHDPNATVWKDLVGGLDIPIYSVGQKEASLIQRFVGSVLTESNQMTIEFRYHVDAKMREYSPKISFSSVGFSYDYVNSFDTVVGTDGNYNFQMLDNKQVVIASSNKGMLSNLQGLLFLDGQQQNLNRNWYGTRSFSKQITIVPGTNIPLYISFLRCYDRVLSADEIAANYAVDKVRFNLT